jgi:hypothetical protein
VDLQTFLSIPITQKCQILSCYALYPLYNIMHCQRLMLAMYTKFGIKIWKKNPLNFIQTDNNCDTLVRYFIGVYFTVFTWPLLGLLLRNSLRQMSLHHLLFALFFYPFTWSSRQSFCSSSSYFILGCPTYVLSARLFLNFLNPSCFNYTSRSVATADGYLASSSEGHRTRWSVLIIYPAISTCSFTIQNMTKVHTQYPDASPQ